ncbi:hypothetical protein HN51_006711 [Arachis hypogaea]|nr:UPF0481 protein-like [Arachis hypogaea]
MVAVFNKDLLSWYLITLKLKETLESGIPASPNEGTGSTEFPEQHKLQQEPSEALHIGINEDEEKSAESEWVISMNEKLEQPNQDDAASSWAKLSINRISRKPYESNIY